MKKGETKADRLAKVAWIEALVAEANTETSQQGCREWPWGRSDKGYAGIRWSGTWRRVGHVVLELVGRPRLDASAHQLHACDNPPCVAPWHLSWGTNVQNRGESIARGRHFTKLTEAQVLHIYSSPDTQRSLAAEFGVTQRVVWQIKHGRTWSRVTGHIPASTNHIHPPTDEPPAMWVELDVLREYDKDPA